MQQRFLLHLIPSLIFLLPLFAYHPSIDHIANFLQYYGCFYCHTVYCYYYFTFVVAAATLFELFIADYQIWIWTLSLIRREFMRSSKARTLCQHTTYTQCNMLQEAKTWRKMRQHIYTHIYYICICIYGGVYCSIILTICLVRWVVHATWFAVHTNNCCNKLLAARRCFLPHTIVYIACCALQLLLCDYFFLLLLVVAAAGLLLAACWTSLIVAWNSEIVIWKLYLLCHFGGCNMANSKRSTH